MGIDVGDLIKIQNDNDPATHDDETVYYYDRDWFRRPFLNRRVFESWYRDFSGVKEITASEMASIRLAAPIVYRPGTRLVKIPSVPKVYAVEPGGVLRWLASEAVAKTLYGDNWSKRVDDVPESYFANYREGAPLVAPLWPTGSVVRRAADASLFLIDGLTMKHLTPDAASVLRYQESDICAAADLSAYGSGGEVQVDDVRLTDTSQYQLVDTKSRPVFDQEEQSSVVSVGGRRDLATLRVSTGMPIIVRRVRVALGGALWKGGEPLLADIRIEATDGESLFGTKQLEAVGASEATLDFEGAYNVAADSLTTLKLTANVSAAAAGSDITVKFERSGFRLGDGGNGDNWTEFYPQDSFASHSLRIE
ncbi:MAG: hypothetical protein WCT10_04905 [Patescibacteria group bacterium]